MAVVNPVLTVTVHSVPAGTVAVPDVKVRVVVDAEPDVVAENVVVPQPADVLSPDGDAMVNVGSTNAKLSPLSRGAFITNVYATDDADHVVGSAITSRLVDSAGATVAVDFVIFIAAMFATFASFSVTAAVRPLQSAG